ncbi:carboxypeptidase [Plakobranchus ocellatus]|uniref:Carboxypeptidase n=1 Tax=Plakobranchus ocellatus TaxID=259542 RepID=A0AAV4C1U8_9GAST|nr:carboxypeptidase [Plakobranchus ocellatus]
MSQKRPNGASLSSFPTQRHLMTSFCLAHFSKTGMIAIISLVCLMQPTVAADEPGENYERSQVMRISASSDADVTFLRQLRHKLNLDTWRDLHQPNSTGDFYVPPHLYSVIRNFLTLHGIPYQVLIDDTARYISEQSERDSKDRVKRASSKHNYRYRYLSYPEMVQFLKELKELESSATSANVQFGSIGQSFEGRDTPYVKITSKREDTPKGTIFIDGGFHSREWISPAMVVEIIHRLVFNTDQDDDTRRLLDMFDFILVPIVNPDGYVFTFTSEYDARLWRKSRTNKYDPNNRCYGVDLNRNFGYMWNDNPVFGGSSDACNPSFSGPHPFSEPESQNLRDLLLSNKDALTGYVSFHSYGQYFLYPWGYRDDVEIEDEQDLIYVASAFQDTMLRKNYSYLVGSSAKSLYPAAGGSSDYVRGAIGVKFAYTVELPPKDVVMPYGGFVVPESEVEAIVTDTWAGVKALLLRLFYYNSHCKEKLTTISSELEEKLQKVGDCANWKSVYGKTTSQAKIEASAEDMNGGANPDLQDVTLSNEDKLLVKKLKMHYDKHIERGLNKESVPQAERESNTENTKDVAKPDLRDVSFEEDTIDENTVDHLPGFENTMYDQYIYSASTEGETIAGMRSGSSKLWSIVKAYHPYSTRLKLITDKVGSMKDQGVECEVAGQNLPANALMTNSHKSPVTCDTSIR